MPSVALATCREFPLLDDEDRLLLPALAALGIDAMPAVWTDDTVDWASFDAVVLRETWDYSGDRPAFLAWVHRVAAVSQLLNPASVVEWNTDKRYLRDLASAGVPVVPTVFLEPGDDPTQWLPRGGVHRRRREARRVVRLARHRALRRRRGPARAARATSAGCSTSSAR